MTKTTTDATHSIAFPLSLAAAVGNRLLAFSGGLPTQHRLPEVGEVIIGRGEEVGVRIEESSLSRQHARIRLSGAQLSIEDLASTNGTRVRGERIQGVVEVAAGELFHVGNVACVIERVAAARTGQRQSKAEQLQTLVELVAGSDISVFIHGETGTGKEVTARAIHAASPRRTKPFVAFNCAALPDTLLESELFGYERGAFSSADRAKPGLLESADGGTIFLDEVAEMSPLVQAKMLRVLEMREVQRLGALRPRAIDVRLVSASHHRIDVGGGGFRQDLYFRINGITVEIPPLRERLDELDGFAAHFLGDAARRAAREAPPRISLEAGRLLRHHPWPGNLRELKNAIERALVLCAGGAEIRPEHLALAPPSPGVAPQALAGGADERERIIEALRQAAGNQGRAAELLGVSRRTLINRLEQFQIPRPRKG